MEVLHGDIRITLTDQDAIRGVERIRATVKRNIKAISREKAVIAIEGNIRDFKRALKESEAAAEKSNAKIEKMEERRLATKDKQEKINLTNQINREKQVLAQREKTLAAGKEGLKTQQQNLNYIKRINKEASLHTKEIQQQEKATADLGKLLDQNNKKLQTEGQIHAKAMREDRERSQRQQEYIQKEGVMRNRAQREMDADFAKRDDDIQKEGMLRKRVEREMGAAFAKRDADERSLARMQSAAMRDNIGRQAKINKLQQEYNKAREVARRIDERRRTVGGRLAEAASPATKQEVEINQARALGEMEILRHELKLMGEKPIDIDTKINDRGNILAKLAGIGDVGARIGPFAGTISQFGKALLALGPIVTGLIGYLGALTGAIGAGLVGAMGLAGSAVIAFGLSLGGVGLLTASLMRDFKNLNTLQAAYHKQVLKTGEGSDKAKTKLAEFNHALGEVTPTTRAAFLSLDKLQNRWRGLRKDVKPDFMNALGEGIKTLNADFDIFGSRTQQAFKRVSKGFQNWMKGLRSRDARTTLDTLMKNANDAIPPLMHSLGQLAGAIGRVAASFSRYLKPEFERFDRWTTGLNRAASNTDKLDNGVDNLMDSFHSLWDVLVGAGRVLEQFMLTAMGPGGHALNDLAGGLNGIADAIAADRVGENKLGKFLRESVDTTGKLYHAVQPLLKLFLEFTTVMRPFTDALLSIIGPLASLTQGLLGLGPIRVALQAWAGLWLLNRGTIGLFTNLASAANVFAKSMKALAGLKIIGMIPGLRDKMLGGAVAGERLAGRTTTGATKLRGGIDDAIAGRRAPYSYPGAVAPRPEAVSKGTTSAFRRGWAMAAPGLAAVGGVMIGGALIGGVSGAIRGKNWKEVWQDAMSTATFGILPGADERQARSTKALIDQTKQSLNNLALSGPKIKFVTNNLTDLLRTGQTFSGQAVERFNLMKLSISDAMDKIRENADKLGPTGVRVATNFVHNLGRIQQGLSSLRASGGDSIRTLRSVFDKNMRLIEITMGTRSAAGVKSAQANFNAFSGAVRRAMDRGVMSTKEGLAAISDAFEVELKAIGYRGSVSQALEIRRYQDEHGRGTGTGQMKAVGGYIGSPDGHGRDTVPLWVGEGEAVLNRHQQKYVNAGLSAIGIKGLPDLFERESTPHYMNKGGVAEAAGGRLPRAVVHGGGLLRPIEQHRLDSYRKTASNKLDSVMDTAPGMAGSTKGLTALVKRAISWARTHGWHGQVTSGFRSYAEQAVLYARYLAGGNIAAKPGQSNHERGLAIDVTDNAAFNRAMKSAPANARLRWFGPGDPVHFSVDGRKRGGFAKAAKGKKPKKKAGGTFSSTSYGPPWGGIQGGGVTATGVNLTKAPHRYGVAVDPSVIPLGSEIYAWPNPFGYRGKFKAFDTGGAIKGQRLDFYDWRGRKAQNGWGRRSVEVSYDRLSTSQGQPQPIKGSQTPNPTHGATMDLGGLIATDEANIGRAERTTGGADDIWAAGALRGRLLQQNKQSKQRIQQIDKKLAGRLTPDNRSSLLSERSGLVSGIESNRQRAFDLRKDARDKLFEFGRGKGNRRVDIDYNKAMAESTDTIDDDLKVAESDRDYWQARLDFLRKNHASRADITEAQNGLNSANGQIKTLQDQQRSNMENAKRTTLAAAAAQASLTPDLNDDLAAAQASAEWVQGMYDLAVATNDTEGIAKWGPELKSARDDVASLQSQIDLLGPQTAQMMASLTTDLNDDVSAAQGLVAFYQALFDSTSGADKITAGQNLAGARSDLASATRNAELLPLERDAALAALTETLDDDKAATVRLRDYWAGQLENAKASGDIPGQIEAAQNLKGLNDQIKEAQQSIANQMILMSEARRDLYKAFGSNFISQIAPGTNVPTNSTTYAGTNVTLNNYFQTPPEDPHTWSQGVAWELQASV